MLKEVEVGVPLAEICRRLGINPALRDVLATAGRGCSAVQIVPTGKEESFSQRETRNLTLSRKPCILSHWKW